MPRLTSETSPSAACEVKHGNRGRFSILVEPGSVGDGDGEPLETTELDLELDAEEGVLSEEPAAPQALPKTQDQPKPTAKAPRFAEAPEQTPESVSKSLSNGSAPKPQPAEMKKVPSAPRSKKLARSQSQQQLLATLERVPSQKLQLIIENPQSIDVNYHVHHDRKLCEGAFGMYVCEATVKGTRAARVAKYIEKEMSVMRRARRLKVEIMISKLVDHPNLIKLYEIFENLTHIILVKELCNGGTLHSRLTSGLPETTTAVVMQQLVSGVHYMHASSVCHRNLKPQNIFVDSPGLLQHNILKITDFSMSCMFTSGKALTADVGTTSYKAPQVFLKSYDEKCDVWSLGVILYHLIAAYLPFAGEDKEEKVRNIMAGRFMLMESVWAGISSDALRLLQSMLKMNPKKRLSASQAWAHSWFEKRTPPKKPPARLVSEAIQKMRSFRALNKFKKAAFHLIVSMLDEAQIRRPREIFMWLDADKDGVLSEDDLKLRLEPSTGSAFGSHPQDSCVLNFYYTEFLAATFDSGHIEDETCRLAFSIFDQDDSGTITMEELADERSPLGHLSDEELRRLVEEMDDNGDGEIDFPEFLIMMRGKFGRNSTQ